MADPYGYDRPLVVDLTDNVNTFRRKVNQVSNDLGDKRRLLTDAGTSLASDSDIVGNLIELDYRVNETSGDLYLRANGGSLYIQNGNTSTIAAEFLYDSAAGNLSLITPMSGDFTIDTVGDIILDADGNDIIFKNGAGGDTVTLNLNDDATFEIDAPSTFTIDAVGDIVLDAGDSDIYFNRQGTTFMRYRMGVSGAGTLLAVVPQGGLIFDVAGDIALDADGGNVSISDAGTTQFNFIAGTNKEIDVPSGDLTIDVAGDINLDADGGDVVILDGGVEDYRFATDGTVSRTGDLVLDITGDITLSADGNDIVFDNGAGGDTVTHTLTDAGVYTITQSGTGDYTVDVGGDIILDADGGDIFFKDAGTTDYQFATDGTVSRSGDLIFDITGDITLDAGGGDIYFLDDGVQRAQYTLGSTNNEDWIGSLTRNVTVAIKDSAGSSIQHVSTTGTVHTVGTNYVMTTGGNYTVDVDGSIADSADSISRTATTTISDTSGTTYTVVAGTNISQTSTAGSTTHASGTTMTHTVGTDYALTAGGNYTVDIDGSIKDSAGTTYAVVAGTTITQTAGTTFDQVSGGNFTTTVTGDVLVDASGTITLDADGNDIIFKNGAGGDTVTHTLTDGGLYTVSHPAGSYVIDAGLDIILDAQDDNIVFKDAGSTRVTYTLGATTDIALDGSLTTNVGGSIFDSAGTSITHVSGTTTTDTVGTDYALTAGGNYTVDVDGSIADSAGTTISRTAGTNITDTASTGSYTLTADTNISQTATTGTITQTSGTTFDQVSGGNFTTTVTGNYNVNATGDIVLDAGDSDIYFQRTGTTFMRYRMGVADTSTTEIEVPQGDFTLDVVGDINLDADGNNVRILDNGVIQYNFISGTNKEIDVPSGNLTIDVAGDIFLDADGGNVQILDDGTTQFDFIAGTNKEIDVPSGDLTLDVAGDINLDADTGLIRLYDATTEFGRFTNTSGNLVVYSPQDDADIIFNGKDDGNIFTALTLDMSDSGSAIFNHNIYLPDNGRAVFGAGSDLQIWHDGSNSYIKDAGTGDLFLQGSNNVQIETADGVNMIYATAGAQVRLFYDGIPKFNTTAIGIDVTGTVTADSATFAGPLNVNLGANGRYATLAGDNANGTRGLQFRSSSNLGTVGAQHTIDATSTNGAILLQTASTNRLLINNIGDIGFYDSVGSVQEFFWDASTNRLGLGTQTPDNTLHVVAGADGEVAQFTGAIENRGLSIYVETAVDASALTRFRANSGGTAGQFAFNTDNNERLRIDEDGNIGINVTDPSEQLHLKAPAAAIRLEDEDNNSYGQIIYNTASGGLLIKSDENGAAGSTGSQIEFHTDGSQKAVITSGGNLGLGSTSPVSKFEIRSSGAQSVISMTRDDTTVLTDDLLGQVSFRSTEDNGGTVNVSAEITAHASQNHDTVLSGGYLTFNTTANGDISTTERVRLNQDGQLWVAKTSSNIATAGVEIKPEGQIWSTRSSGPAASFNRETNRGSIVAFYDSAALIGAIGTIENDGEKDFYIAFENDDKDVGLGMGNFSGTGRAYYPSRADGTRVSGAINIGTSDWRYRNLYLTDDIQVATNSELKSDGNLVLSADQDNNNTNDNSSNIIFKVDGSEIARFDSAGVLGIGTDAPVTSSGEKLHVYDNSSASVRVESTTGYATGFYYAADAGAAGIRLYKNNTQKWRIETQAGAGTDNLRFIGPSTELMSLTDSGELGLGITNPLAQFHMKSASGNNELRIDTPSGNNDSILNFRENGVDRASLYWDGADNDLYLETTLGDIALMPTGNVGIGIRAPATRLDVREENTGGDVLIQVYNEDNSNTTTQTAGIALGPDTRGATARITAVKENADFSTSAERDVALTFSSVLNNTPTERARITSDGDLLVNTTSTAVGASTTEEGFTYIAGQDVQVARENGTVAVFNRWGTSAAGTIVSIKADGAEVGTIGSNTSSYLYIGRGDTTLSFSDVSDLIYPTGTSGAQRDGFVSLGNGANRFKDLHLLGTAYLPSVDIDSGSIVGLTELGTGASPIVASTIQNLTVTNLLTAPLVSPTTVSFNDYDSGTNSNVITFGNDSDMVMYHDGLNSYINHKGTGDLRILADSFRIRNAADNSNMIIGSNGGAVTLYHNGNSKLVTTSTGVTVTGLLTADTKSFTIDHPTKEGMKLRYGSLEGPEHGVYVRGRLNGENTIELPEVWLGLVDEDTITVNLTPIGKGECWVEDIQNNTVTVGGHLNCFYMVLAERKDVEKLEVEFPADGS